ncbi:hypothetical protein M0805_009068 [Coniferiporia weirii]|nr:hypothetical protein M0805_009068 [Coniferiporia weirii]
MDKLKGAKYFTKLDLHSGYNNIHIKNSDQWKAAFKTPQGLFEPTVMFFGLCNSPATFQAFMNDTFCFTILKDRTLIYMDDILIPAASLNELYQCMCCILDLCIANNLYCKPEKCLFGVQTVEFLRMTITLDNILMNPIKLSGIINWPTPHTVKQLRSFMGFCNYYCRFIPNFSNIVYPLNELTCTNEPWTWTPNCDQAFLKLKSLFPNKPALLVPDPTEPFIPETDASKVASGMVLYQTNSNGNLQPCGYISETFGPVQQQYKVYDHELLGIICGLEAWCHYLLSNPHTTTIWCDHKNLSYFCSDHHLTPHQSQWNLFLSQFNCIITHHPGKSIPGANALSRQPDHGEEPPKERTMLLDTLFIGTINVNLQNCIHVAQEQDNFAATIQHAQKLKIPSPFRFSLEDWTTDSGLL